jgi:hypothetical protein
MRNSLKIAAPVATLARVLAALELELVEATDEEILEAARDLGMDPEMKGSAAFLGLTYPVRAQLADYFDLEAIRNARAAAAERLAGKAPKIEHDE